MTDVTPPIRILPMSKEEDEFKGLTVDEVQSQYFLADLPFRQDGRYYYRTSGLEADAGTIVLFQYDKKIIARAIFEGSEPFKQPDHGGYHGTLKFRIDSIRVFDPVGPDILLELWPEFGGFSNVKLKLNATAFPEFERRLTGIEAPAPQAHDLKAPPAARVWTTDFRIVRDTQLSTRVKSLHKHKCQILTCEYTIVLGNGLHYAEAHHVKPLGEPHNGPDVLENIVCLCPNHHAACDLGAIRLVAADLRQVTGHVIGQEFLDYHNQIIYPIGRAGCLAAPESYDTMNANYRFTEAATWLLIADLMRRHEHPAGLRVIETHPGGGTYDCRTVLKPSATDFGPNIHFNIQSGNATCNGTFGARRPVRSPRWAGDEPDRLAYVDAVLQAPNRMDVVNHLEAMLGLPSPPESPVTTRHALSYRLMAEVAARSIFDGPVVRWENGREDTAGYGSDDPIRLPLRRVPEIARRLAEASEPRTPADAKGYRYWILTTRQQPGETGEAAAIVDALDAMLYRLNGKDEPVDLYERYDEVGRNLRRLADSIL